MSDADVQNLKSVEVRARAEMTSGVWEHVVCLTAHQVPAEVFGILLTRLGEGLSFMRPTPELVRFSISELDEMSVVAHFETAPDGVTTIKLMMPDEVPLELE